MRAALQEKITHDCKIQYEFKLKSALSTIASFRHLSASYIQNKETTLERADLTLQLSIFVTAEKERGMIIILFFSSFCQLLYP